MADACSQWAVSLKSPLWRHVQKNLRDPKTGAAKVVAPRCGRTVWATGAGRGVGRVWGVTGGAAGGVGVVRRQRSRRSREAEGRGS